MQIIIVRIHNAYLQAKAFPRYDLYSHIAHIYIYSAGLPMHQAFGTLGGFHCYYHLFGHIRRDNADSYCNRE